MTIMTAYLDASGTQMRDGVYSVAGFIADAEQWARFDEEWRSALRAVGIRRFHTTDFEAPGRGEFAGWAEEDRRKLLNQLLTVIEHYTFASAAFAVSHEMYHRQVPEIVKDLVGGSPYYFLFLNIVTSVDYLLENLVHYTTIANDCCVAYVLARGDAGSGTIVNAWMAPSAGAVEGRKMSRTDSVSIAANNSDHPGLEAADLLAFETRKQVQLQLRQHSRSPRYPLRRIEDNGNPRRWNFYQHPYHLRFNSDVIERTVAREASRFAPDVGLGGQRPRIATAPACP